MEEQTSVNLNDFLREVECTYKHEQYSVRDNGAVLRHAPPDKRSRPTDNKWTFGKENSKTGYFEIASVSIHRIVATAFHGAPPRKEHVVDHIDTNKKNNRPENLRWVTRLENILLNPITVKRIELVCGSVEAFLADPSKFRDKFQEPNYQWMCTVSIEEAQASKERLLAWAKSDKIPYSGSLGNWIYNRFFSKTVIEEIPEITSSLTSNALQKNWKIPSEFPCCPGEITETPIYSYANNLKIGETFSKNKFSTWIIADYAISKDGNTLWIVCTSHETNAIKPWSLGQVTFEDNVFVHANLGSFFKKDGAEKHFILAQGLEWTGGDTYDDLT